MNLKTRRKSAGKRRAFTLLELLAASFVLGVAMVASVQISSALGRARQEAQHRQCALLEADNWLERLSALPWDELTPERAAKCELSEVAAEQLPGGELKVEITPLQEQPAVKRIVAAVHWRDMRGQPLTPIRLTTWAYQVNKPAARNDR